MVSSIKALKQTTGYSFAKEKRKHLWQKSFYDHILRQEEEVKKTMEYIVNNPVRKELVGNWKEYPYLGSFVYNLTEIF